MKKVGKIVKLHILPCLVCAVLLFTPLSVARAAVWEGNASIGYTYWGSTDGVAYMHSKDVLLPFAGGSLAETVNQRVTNGMRLDLGEVKWAKPLKVYISGFYFNTHSNATITEVGQPWNANNYEIKFTVEEFDSTGAIGIDGISVFVPNYDAAFVGDGLSLVASLDASEENPVSNVLVRPYKECGWKRGGASSLQGFWYWTSVRVISAETSAELDELNNIAQQIVAGNETLEAMLGDVVGLLQQIYAITGDIEIAADRTVDLLDTMLGYVDGLEGQLTDIYGVLGTVLSRLIANHNDLIDVLSSNHEELFGVLLSILDALEGSGNALEHAGTQTVEGDQVQDGLAELQKPDYDDFDLNVDDYAPDGDMSQLGAAIAPIFGNSMIFSMLMVSLTFVLVSYVLYGKR